MMEALSTDTLVQLAYALGIGTLIGLERALDGAHDRPRPEGDRAADQEVDGAEGADASPGEPPPETEDDPEEVGVRTFSVLAIAGYVGALVGEQIRFVPAVLLLVVGLVVVMMYLRTSPRGGGITTEIAAIGTCALGLLCRSHPEVAAVIAVVVTTILASKRFTHRTVRRVRRVELMDTLKFLIIILIVLPVLPDEALDPWGAFNPHTVGLLVVLISGIGFVGYFFTRVLGPRRGLALTGVIGGLTSSTAVTVAMSRQAREHPSWAPYCMAGTLAANAVMFARVVVIVGAFDLGLGVRIGWSVGVMAVVMAAVTAWLTLRSPPQRADPGAAGVELRNPFSLGPATEFAALFVAIRFTLELARHYLGEGGIYLAASLSGLADVDAISLSVAEQTSKATMEAPVAAVAITLAVAANTVSKGAIAVWMGGGRFGRRVAAGLSVATLVGALVGWAVWRLS